MPKNISVYCPDERLHIAEEMKQKTGKKFSQITVDFWEQYLGKNADVESVDTMAERDAAELVEQVYQATFGDIHSQSDWLSITDNPKQMMQNRLNMLMANHPKEYSGVRMLFAERLPRLAELVGLKHE